MTIVSDLEVGSQRLKRSVAELLELAEFRHEKRIELNKDGAAHIKRSFVITNRSSAPVEFTKDQPCIFSVREETLQITNPSLKDQDGNQLLPKRKEVYGAALLQAVIDDRVLRIGESYRVTFEYDYQNLATKIGRLWVILEPYTSRTGPKEGEQYSVEYVLPRLDGKLRFWEELRVVAKLDGSEQKACKTHQRKTVSWNFVLCPGGEKHVQITYGLETREKLLAAISAAGGIVFSFALKEILAAIAAYLGLP
jgi:hypothetical protein